MTFIEAANLKFIDEGIIVEARRGKSEEESVPDDENPRNIGSGRHGPDADAHSAAIAAASIVVDSAAAVMLTADGTTIVAATIAMAATGDVAS
jgi:hypothetical protein